MPLRLVPADDAALICQALAELLERAGMHVVAQAGNASSLLCAVEEDPAAAVQGVLFQVAGVGPAAHLLQCPAQVGSDRQRVLVIGAEPVTPVLAQVAGRPRRCALAAAAATAS
jgi:hypothetical protein